MKFTEESKRSNDPEQEGIPVLGVLKPGFQTMIQDLGRTGQLRHGVPSGGAMDRYAFRIANELVDNLENSPCLEITLTGLRIEILRDCVMAITGARLSPQIDGKSVVTWQSFTVNRGAQLCFSKRENGCRAYLSVGGGFQGDPVLGSCSTDLRNHWGGTRGRALMAGDILRTNHEPAKRSALTCRKVRPDIFRTYDDPLTLRVIVGPQIECFSRAAMRQLFDGVYRVRSDSDRMGYRLQGSILQANRPEIISDPIPVGALQVLPNGQLILLMMDRPTVGGYPKIAVVCSADFPKAAQLNIGDSVRFKEVTLNEALELLREQEERLREGIVVD